MANNGYFVCYILPASCTQMVVQWTLTWAIWYKTHRKIISKSLRSNMNCTVRWVQPFNSVKYVQRMTKI